MTDVFNAMKANVDAITECQVASEIEDKACSDLEKAKKWYCTCQKATSVARKAAGESERSLGYAISDARKAKLKTGE